MHILYVVLFTTSGCQKSDTIPPCNPLTFELAITVDAACCSRPPGTPQCSDTWIFCNLCHNSTNPYHEWCLCMLQLVLICVLCCSILYFLQNWNVNLVINWQCVDPAFHDRLRTPLALTPCHSQQLTDDNLTHVGHHCSFFTLLELFCLSRITSLLHENFIRAVLHVKDYYRLVISISAILLKQD